ncbi:MAG: hypothetical protein C4523_08645 [Myxococcales bacterium]|nr:MAG: hypothetical protein C4523_08645 [Myxococcales bacterium]
MPIIPKITTFRWGTRFVGLVISRARRELTPDIEKLRQAQALIIDCITILRCVAKIPEKTSNVAGQVAGSIFVNVEAIRIDKYAGVQYVHAGSTFDSLPVIFRCGCIQGEHK